MNPIDLEGVLSRVAKLVDTNKSELLRGAGEPEEGMPSTILKDYTKGELIAELLYLEFRGSWRNRLDWY